MDNETIELSADEFSKLNWIIRSKLTKINNEELHFVDKGNEGPFVKTPINMNNKVSLFIDDNDDDPFEKSHNKCKRKERTTQKTYKDNK